MIEEYLNYLRETEGDSFIKNISQRRLAAPHDEFVARKLKDRLPGSILEIGRYKGFSLGLFKHFSPESLVVSIDIEMHSEVFRIVRNRQKVVLVNGTSHLLNELKTSFDLALIDGDHSYKWAKQDWLNVLPWMNSNSIVLFDDLGHGDNCAQAFDEIDCKEFHKDRFHNMGIIYIHGENRHRYKEMLPL